MIRVKKPLTGPFADSKKPDRPNRTVSRGARFARLVRPGYQLRNRTGAVRLVTATLFLYTF
jgi:hypothetical protein